MINFVLYLPVIFSWSIMPFFYKSLSKYINTTDIILVIHFVYHIIILTYCIFMLLFRYNKSIEFIKRTTSMPINMNIMTIVFTGIAIISQLSYFHIVKNNDVNEFVHIIRGGSAILVVLIGYYYFKEKITVLKTIGIIMTLFGIYIINNY
jgi:uncharacterized membrane protein